MKILKNAGSFKILDSQEDLQLQMIKIEKAGRTCYQSSVDKINMHTVYKFIEMLIKRGHESVLEHGCMTVQFNNCSRGLTHELVRHRLMAISQESTRYVDYAKPGEDLDLDKFQLYCVVPPHKNENEWIELEDGSKTSLENMFQTIEMFYRGLRKAGWKPEDARQILPIGLKSQIVVTANFREWRHIFKMRTAKVAHWEIRGIMCQLLKKVKNDLNPLFDDFIEKDGYYEKVVL
jgi:thymidylate synthase (FAD)